MCGIAGVVNSRGVPVGDEALNKMIALLRHRGPDDQGIWTQANVGLAHTRLAIIDLSPLGRQPMVSASGKSVVVFNGEIYNFLSLRKELEKVGVAFTSRSDTEVLLAGYETWGIDRLVKVLAGMFAFAIWDKERQILHLVRDRFGKKPLYYQAAPAGLLFASELKALLGIMPARPDLNPTAVADYFTWGYVPEGECIFAGISKIPPGHYATCDANGAFRLNCYWDVRELPWEAEGTLSWKDALARLESLLRAAVQQRLISDVPLGAFLSGGVDSALVAAFMQETAGTTVRTFSISFGDHRYDESPYARQVAQHLGVDHTVIDFSLDDLLRLLPDVIRSYDEPFGDSSAFPTHALCKMVRCAVTVALSGDGGDEVLCGYDRYRWVHRLATVRRLAGSLAPLLGWLAEKVDRRRGARIRRCLSQGSMPDIYRQLMIGDWQDELFAERYPGDGGSRGPVSLSGRLTPWGDAQLHDALHYLPGDILVKVDRASMHYALEVRNPFLDHRVAEFAFSLPAAIKVRKGELKALTKALLRRRLPGPLVDRDKMGFLAPIEQWLPGPLRAFAEERLDPAWLRRQGILQPELIQEVWKRFIQGERHLSFLLWRILAFQEWYNLYGENQEPL